MIRRACIEIRDDTVQFPYFLKSHLFSSIVSSISHRPHLQKPRRHIHNLTPHILRHELAQNIIRRIRRDPSIQPIVQKKMHGPQIRELHPINLLAFVVITQEFDESLSAKETAKPWPNCLVAREEADVAIGAFVACAGEDDFSERCFGCWTEAVQ
jgi:hypothetical protein